MFMKFKNYLPSNSSGGKALVSLKNNAKMADLLDILGIPLEEPKLIIINGISRGVSNSVKTETLNEGDVVAIFPPAGGG